METLRVYLEGLGLGASLIIAIGAQNAYVLRLGLEKRLVLLAALFCAGSDALLIVAGVYGLGQLLTGQQWFLPAMSWGGGAFLMVYGLRSLVRAVRGQSWPSTDQKLEVTMPTVVATLGAFTFLNPHVYLDTVLLLGGLGARHSADLRPWFVVGAVTASALWFFGLAYGARLLIPFFQHKNVWRVLDLGIAAVMVGLALSLVMSAGA